MNLIQKIKIKIATLWEFNLFQRFGFPFVKQEKISKSIFKKYLPVQPIIIDCGAYDGTDSEELSKIFGGQIHAFEPVDAIFERLKIRVSKNDNIYCYKMALSDQTGIQTFYVSDGNSDASSSLLEPKDHLIDHPDTSFKDKIKVQTITLDDWAIQNNIRRVDLLWLDMQGFELSMLKASKIILPTVRVIHTEVSMKETYKDVPQYSDLKQFLLSIGFNVTLEAIPSGWDMGNVLFVRV